MHTRCANISLHTLCYGDPCLLRRKYKPISRGGGRGRDVPVCLLCFSFLNTLLPGSHPADRDPHTRTLLSVEPHTSEKSLKEKTETFAPLCFSIPFRYVKQRFVVSLIVLAVVVYFCFFAVAVWWKLLLWWMRPELGLRYSVDPGGD